jgi:hypothetical protein
MASRTGAGEDLGRAFAGLEIFRLHRDRRQTADQKRHRRYNERSAQHSCSPDAKIAQAPGFEVRLPENLRATTPAAAVTF